jgi:hypothetical protein
MDLTPLLAKKSAARVRFGEGGELKGVEGCELVDGHIEDVDGVGGNDLELLPTFGCDILGNDTGSPPELSMTPGDELLESRDEKRGEGDAEGDGGRGMAEGVLVRGDIFSSSGPSTITSTPCACEVTTLPFISSSVRP